MWKKYQYTFLLYLHDKESKMSNISVNTNTYKFLKVPENRVKKLEIYLCIFHKNSKKKILGQG